MYSASLLNLGKVNEVLNEVSKVTKLCLVIKGLQALLVKL